MFNSNHMLSFSKDFRTLYINDFFFSRDQEIRFSKYSLTLPLNSLSSRGPLLFDVLPLVPFRDSLLEAAKDPNNSTINLAREAIHLLRPIFNFKGLKIKKPGDRFYLEIDGNDIILEDYALYEYVIQLLYNGYWAENILNLCLEALKSDTYLDKNLLGCFTLFPDGDLLLSASISNGVILGYTGTSVEDSLKSPLYVFSGGHPPSLPYVIENGQPPKIYYVKVKYSDLLLNRDSNPNLGIVAKKAQIVGINHYANHKLANNYKSAIFTKNNISVFELEKEASPEEKFIYPVYRKQKAML